VVEWKLKGRFMENPADEDSHGAAAGPVPPKTSTCVLSNHPFTRSRLLFSSTSTPRTTMFFKVFLDEVNRLLPCRPTTSLRPVQFWDRGMEYFIISIFEIWNLFSMSRLVIDGFD
jgi:hypothetical protein